MRIPKDLRILAESKSYNLGNIYEDGYLIDKKNGKNIYLGFSYGDPHFGIIDEHEQWAVLFGHTTYLWRPSEMLALTKIIHLPGKYSNGHLMADRSMILKWKFLRIPGVITLAFLVLIYRRK